MILKILICMYGTCFNPNQIVLLKPISHGYFEGITFHSQDKGCTIHFTRDSSGIAGTIIVKDKPCETVTREINERFIMGYNVQKDISN